MVCLDSAGVRMRVLLTLSKAIYFLIKRGILARSKRSTYIWVVKLLNMFVIRTNLARLASMV